jgi:amidohydrolase
LEKHIDFLDEAHAILQELVAWRRDFHMHPELGFEETRTASIVAELLTGFSYWVRTGVAKTGLVGLLDGAGPGPVVMLRFDMDALPVQEANEVEYASQVPGKMHACGHDGHLAIGLGVAKLLACHRDWWPGTLKLVFQPAEEGGGGAEMMVQEGVLENPPVDAVFALHLRNDLPLGQAMVTAGPVMTASERWELKIAGRGGHGARPHQAVDPIIVAAQVVVGLQTIVSRSIDPQEPSVVSVGTIYGGQAFNVIPPQVELTGTIRSFDPEVRRTVLRRLREIIEGVCAAMGAQADLRLIPTCPALVNDPTVTEVMRAAAETVLGPENVRSGERTMGSEDAAFYLQEVPGCYMFLGAANAGRGLNYPNHNPRFDFDEEALPLGVAILAQACLLYSQALLGTPRHRLGEPSHESTTVR